LLVPLRKLCGLEDIITLRHVELMCKVTLAMGSIVGFAYLLENFTAWYSGNLFEKWTYWRRNFGDYAWGGWVMLGLNVLIPQLFWFKRCRQNLLAVFVISILVNVGMWMERFVIIVGGLHEDFLPSSWGNYMPTWVDVCTFLGSFGLFFTLFLLFIRFLPLISISEVKGLLPQADPAHPLGGLGQKTKAAGTRIPAISTGPNVLGVIAGFENPAALIEAARRVRAGSPRSRMCSVSSPDSKPRPRSSRRPGGCGQRDTGIGMCSRRSQSGEWTGPWA
jgi:hypothetical protein